MINVQILTLESHNAEEKLLLLDLGSATKHSMNNWNRTRIQLNVIRSINEIALVQD